MDSKEQHKRHFSPLPTGFGESLIEHCHINRKIFGSYQLTQLALNKSDRFVWSPFFNFILKGLPLSKHFLWALCPWALWNKCHWFVEGSILRVRLILFISFLKTLWSSSLCLCGRFKSHLTQMFVWLVGAPSPHSSWQVQASQPTMGSFSNAARNNPPPHGSGSRFHGSVRRWHT